jgi:hypothetical protein
MITIVPFAPVPASAPNTSTAISSAAMIRPITIRLQVSKLSASAPTPAPAARISLDDNWGTGWQSVALFNVGGPIADADDDNYEVSDDQLPSIAIGAGCQLRANLTYTQGTNASIVFELSVEDGTPDPAE